MGNEEKAAWRKLLDGYPWFSGAGQYPISAYSEFMPPPRLGRRAYGETDASLFNSDDDYGWNISEVEEEYELRPGLANIALQIVNEIIELGSGKPAWRICGHQRSNLTDNPCWPPELAERAGQLPHEKYVTLLPLALSKTQDDKGRHRWTFFGGSEQGPEKAIWQGFYSAPGQEKPPNEALAFLVKLMVTVYGEPCQEPSDLRSIGFRILPSSVNSRFPYWTNSPLPSSIGSLLWKEDMPLDGVHYLLTFTPFGLLPASVRQGYLSGSLVLLPFPGSLVFWGMPRYVRLQEEMPMAMQLPLQKLVARHGGPEGIRIPQSGWFHEPGNDRPLPEVHESLLLNTYKRTSRWDRAHRHDNEIAMSTIEDSIAKTLFSTDLDVMGLYNKPMVRNCQVFTSALRLLIDGPAAGRDELLRAAETVGPGGTFRYRFQFPPSQVGVHQVYWQRPIIAYRPADGAAAQFLTDGPAGYMTAYRTGETNLENPIELWPRLQQRDLYLLALRNFEHLQERYRHQTALNIVRLLDLSRRWEDKPLPKSLARQILRLPERETLESWLLSLPEKSASREEGERLRAGLESRLEPSAGVGRHAWLPGVPQPAEPPPALTYLYTANRAFEEAWWTDIRTLSEGQYLNKNNADCVKDTATEAQLSHRHRDLEPLGEYLLDRHRQAISATGMDNIAVCGELRFNWSTDFDFAEFGGWKNDQEGHTRERDLMVVIPGKNRNEAVIFADHYDTAYMEDVYSKARGGTGARLAAAGADDNCSATATLLQAALVFLKMSKLGLLERDIWLIHLTGEEFPADCLGARKLCQTLVEKNLSLRLADGQVNNLADTRVLGVFIMDMVAHNRDDDMDVFQISPGKGRASLRLAYQAHLANLAWNVATLRWNNTPERLGKGRGRRLQGGEAIPEMAEHARLQGQARLIEDPHSSLYNTDGQIFSDCGIPVVLFMENYDISRSGYHDSADTMTNIDLDYGAAVAAIAIETVARAATERSL